MSSGKKPNLKINLPPAKTGEKAVLEKMERFRLFRELLGKSQKRMGEELPFGLQGNAAQKRVLFYEREARKFKPEIAEYLTSAYGMNPAWWEFGEPPMIKLGVELVRDGNGEATGIKPQVVLGGHLIQTPPKDQLRREAQALVDEVVADLKTPEQRGHYLELVDEVAGLLEKLHAQGKAHEIRVRLESALPAAKERG